MKGTRARESTQRLGRSERDTTEIMTMRKGEAVGGRGGAEMAKTGGGDTDADSHIHHLRETFIPRIKG